MVFQLLFFLLEYLVSLNTINKNKAFSNRLLMWELEKIAKVKKIE